MGNLVSKTGDWLTVGALMGWIFQQTGSTGSVALLMLVRLAPPILGGGAAAALVDGVRKERLLVWVELLRAVALAGVLAGMLAGVMPVVYVAIAFSGLLGAISPVAVSALIPRLVPAAELPAANGLAGVIDSTAMATGALAGGALLALVGLGPALAADLVTFVLAALLFAGISPPARTPPRPRRPRRTTRPRPGCATCSATARSSPRSARCASPSPAPGWSTRRCRATSPTWASARVRTASASARSRSAWRSAARSAA